MKRKIKYSRRQIYWFKVFYSDIREITKYYLFLKITIAISTFLATNIGIGIMMQLPNKIFSKLLKPVIITVIIILLLCFKGLNKLQNEDIYDYLNKLDCREK